MTLTVEINRTYRHTDDLSDTVTVLAVRDGIVTFQRVGSHHVTKSHVDTFLSTYERFGRV